ncbi:MAG: hypothetical protein KDN05_04665 [Verrucomicrobiae bacterium]|nr:hypothetical protein [Verrucomicrobiae bacterium]
MRRSHATTLASSVILVTFAYAAVCLRVYYTDPAIRANPDLPAPVVEAMVTAEKENDFLKPEPYTWSGALHHLMHPWEADVREVEMMWVGQPNPLPSGELHPKADRGTAWIEIWGNGGLRGDLTYKMDGITNVRVTPPFEP